MKDNDLILNKPSALIAMSMSKSLTLTQHKIYDILLYFAQVSLRKNPINCKFSVKLFELKMLLYGDKAKNRRAKEALKGLGNIECECNLFGKDTTVEKGLKLKLFEDIIIEPETGTVKYSFPNQVVDMLTRCC